MLIYFTLKISPKVLEIKNVKTGVIHLTYIYWEYTLDQAFIVPMIWQLTIYSCKKDKQ